MRRPNTTNSYRPLHLSSREAPRMNTSGAGASVSSSRLSMPPRQNRLSRRQQLFVPYRVLELTRVYGPRSIVVGLVKSVAYCAAFIGCPADVPPAVGAERECLLVRRALAVQRLPRDPKLDESVRVRGGLLRLHPSADRLLQIFRLPPAPSACRLRWISRVLSWSFCAMAVRLTPIRVWCLRRSTIARTLQGRHSPSRTSSSRRIPARQRHRLAETADRKLGSCSTPRSRFLRTSGGPPSRRSGV